MSKIMPQIETERLRLRPFERSDAEALFQNCLSDPEVVRYMPCHPCESLEATQVHIDQWLAWFQENLEAGAMWCVFAVVLKASGAFIGTADFYETNRAAHVAEVGYQFGKLWWGKGYATEALRALIDHCFTATDLNRLWADHDVRNTASGKVLRKAGMLHEGTFRQCKLRKDELVDKAHYAILKEDWGRRGESFSMPHYASPKARKNHQNEAFFVSL